MNLYSEKDKNIRKTYILFSAFLIFIIGVGWIFGQIYNSSAILIIAVLFSVITSFISYWYSDKIVLAMTRAKPVSRENYRELYNIVENLTIAAGLPMPRVYIVEEEMPNAFATGRSPQKAVVAVTRGLIERLDRSEIEGVLAHELSHIGNRDMLISTMAVVLVGFIAILSDMFLRSMFWGAMAGGGRRGKGNALFMVIGIIFAILAPIAAMLIQLAISRRREFLADASGALLTRYPDGLASALEKISQYSKPMNIASNSTAHLWLADPYGTKRSFLAKLFMTHPPIEERIATLRGMKI